MIYRSMFGLPSWRTRTPFEELDRLRRQMDLLSDAYFERPSARGPAGVFPPINLSEDRDHYYVRAEMAGIRNEDIDLEAASKSISISGERKLDETGADVRYHRREREAGTFSRIVSLPGDFDADKVEASLVDGILTIRVPKAEAIKPRQIEIRQP